MIIFKKLFDPAQLGTGATTYYTCPANQKCVIKKLTFSNNTATARTITVYLVPTGGTAADTNTIQKVQTIGPNSIYEMFGAENQVLNAGDSIQALSDGATAVSIMGAGLEVAV